MGYFLQHQIKDINTKLEQLQDQEKLAYLNVQLHLAENELKSNLKLYQKAFIIFFNQRKLYNPSYFKSHILNYSKYVDEKIKLMYPPFVIPLFGIIKSAAIVRYIILVKRERKRLIKFINNKIIFLSNHIENTKVEPLLKSEADQYANIYVANKSQLNEIELFRQGYFYLNPLLDLTNVKWHSKFNYEIYRNGYQDILSLIDSLTLDEKIVALNSIKKDVEQFMIALNIDKEKLFTIISDISAALKTSPELVLVLYDNYKMLKNVKNKEFVNISEMLLVTAANKTQLNSAITYIEKDLKIFELQRILAKENAVKKEEAKKSKSKPSLKKRKIPEREKIIWFGSETQLIDLFYLLRSSSFLTEYDESTIFPHFDIKGEITSDISRILKLTSDHFFWLGADNDFALLVDELAKAALISESNKYKLFGAHFQNSRSKPFKSLAQKHYNKKNYINLNTKIPVLVKKIANIL